MKRLASLLFLWLPFVHSNYTPCLLCVNQATPAVLSDMELRFYTGQTLDEFNTVRIGNALTLLDRIDNSKPTVVYVSRWLTNPDEPTVRTVTSAYLARGDHNIILLDWRWIAGQSYVYTLLSVNGVGFTLAKALNDLVAGGLNPSSLHLVGHSFGAQVCGYVGRYVDFRVPRITGLDPAGIGFYGVSERLSSADADFVVVINTDVYLYGINAHLAHADFYPNGGFRPQPGCPRFAFPISTGDFCSHDRAVYFYAESVLNTRSFPSLKCDSYSEFHSGVCLSNERVVMGFATPTTAAGKFYLQTKNSPLFDQGDDGLTYKP